MSCHFALGSYITDNFVETGSGNGGAIKAALKLGFKDIYSVEIDPIRYDHCVNKFKNNANVHLSYGDSSLWLKDIMDKIDTKCTFLLDAHVMNSDTEIHSKVICPLLAELECIMEHSKKHNLHHYILIDDLKYLDGKTATFGNYGLREIYEIAKRTYPPYCVETKGRYVLMS